MSGLKGALKYIEQSVPYGLLWPKTDEMGRFTYKFFLLLPSPLIFGYVGYKGGLKIFVEEYDLSSSKARAFIEKHQMHNLWNDMGIDEQAGLKNTYSERKARIWVRSASGHDEQYYQIGLNNIPDVLDDKKDIIRCLSRLDIRHIRHICGICDSTHDYILPQKSVKRWSRYKDIGNLRIHFICSRQIDAWLKLANDPHRRYAMDFNGIFKEKNLEKSVGSQLSRINEGSLKMGTLNKLAFPEIFEETKLTKLIYEELYALFD
jgi:hypothetical protein